MLGDVRAVIFDAVGTLIAPDPPAADVYAIAGARFGSRLAIDDVHRRFREAFAAEEIRDRSAGWRTSPEREVERWRAIVAHALPDIADCERCFQVLWEHFAEPAFWRTITGAAAVTGELRNRGLRLGVASNFDSRLRSVLAGMPDLPHDWPIIISAEVGWRKPAREFYAAIADAVQYEPRDILIVGDDYVNDIEAAHAAGMHAVLFDPTGQAQPSIAALRELLK